MGRKLSSFWDMEKQIGKLIIHDEHKTYAEFVCPEQSLDSFNQWSNEAAPFINVGTTHDR